jgi:hypothetical protein
MEHELRNSHFGALSAVSMFAGSPVDAAPARAYGAGGHIKKIIHFCSASEWE